MPYFVRESFAERQRAALEKQGEVQSSSATRSDRQPQNSQSAPTITHSRVVSQAAAILEDEMRRNALAKEHPPNRLQPWVSTDLGPMWKQLRVQAHDWVEAFLSVLAQSPQQVPEVALRVEGLRSFFEGIHSDTIPILKPATAVKPGQTAQILIALQNEDFVGATEYALNATDLMGPSGCNIPVSQVVITPRKKTISAGGVVDVQIEINVPVQTLPGRYTGHLEWDGFDDPGAVLAVCVFA